MGAFSRLVEGGSEGRTRHSRVITEEPNCRHKKEFTSASYSVSELDRVLPKFVACWRDSSGKYFKPRRISNLFMGLKRIFKDSKDPGRFLFFFCSKI